VKPVEDPEDLARRVLERTGYLDTYRTRPRLDLASILRQHGLQWRRTDLAGLAGALVQVDGYYYVVTNLKESWARQRFTAAHELKHYLMDRRMAPMFTCSRNLDNRLERAANVFARELLMPAEVVRWLWENGAYAPEQIGRVLGVSAQAVALRTAELEIGREKVWWE